MCNFWPTINLRATVILIPNVGSGDRGYNRNHIHIGNYDPYRFLTLNWNNCSIPQLSKCNI